MRYFKHLKIAGLCLALGAAACADLEVTNPNDADAARAIRTASDVESLVSGSYNTWYNGAYSYGGPGMFLSNASFQHTAPWANAAMEFYGRLPREAIVNDAADTNYGNFTSPWYASYRAISAASDGMRALAKPEIGGQLPAADVQRDKAFGYFTLGMAHATIALLYDQGFVVDETVDISTPQEAKTYKQVMDAAMGYFDKAISLAGSGSFSIPTTWIPTDAEVTNAELVKVAHSMKARYLAAVARTPAERAAVQWTKVIQEANAGVTANWVMDANPDNGWYFEALDYGTSPGWSEATYFVYGMADQSGNYQLWLSKPLGDKAAIIGGKDILIVTPDNRFPQGATVADQTVNEGRYLVIPTNATYHTTPAGVWKRPDRGTWRWSYYYNKRFYQYNGWNDFHVPEINIAEMDMLKAEGMYRAGDKAGAATLVNKWRVAAGLNATDANGTNTSCVPKLPNGNCGDLLEMLKWEKRLEGMWQGLLQAPWYFDSRGWGDLYKGTPLQFPAPCKELQVLQMLPCYTFGGGSYPSAAPASNYKWPFEG